MSLVCGTNKIAWAHVDREMKVLDWQEMACPNFLKGLYLASPYLNDVSMTIIQTSYRETLDYLKPIHNRTD